MSVLDDIELSLGHVKRFSESVIDLKCLLKVAATSFCFDNNLFFSSCIIFSWILSFLSKKYGLHAFHNGLELQSTLCFSKYCNLVCLFRFVARFRWCLYVTMSIKFFYLLALFLRRDLIIICFGRLPLKWGFWFPRKIFVFLGACLSKIETKFFSKAAWVLTADMLLQISNLNCSLSNCLKLRYINFFGPNFSNFDLRIVYIKWWLSLKPVSEEFVLINENFEFVISKYMHKLPSPLKHVFCFIIL